MTVTFLLIYLVGFVFSLLIFIVFGKAMGFDYDQPKTYANAEDWDSNKEAYSAFAIFWPITMTMLGIFGFYKLLEYLTGKLIQYVRSKQVH